MKTILRFILLFLLSFSIVQAYSPADAQTDEACEVLPLRALYLPASSGRFVWETDHTLYDLNGEYTLYSEYAYNLSNFSISPNGQYLTALRRFESDDDSLSEVVVFDQRGVLVYTGAPTTSYRSNVFWLSDEELLNYAMVFDYKYFDPGPYFGGLEFYYRTGIYRIFPFQREYQFSLVPRNSPLQSDRTLISNGLTSTFDGRYLFAHRGVFYDLLADKAPDSDAFAHFRFGQPSSTSYRLIGIEENTDSTGGGYSVYVYDLENDTLTYVSTINTFIDPFGQPFSWSPDERYFLYAETGSHNGIESPRRIWLYDLHSGERVNTCLTQHLTIDARDPSMPQVYRQDPEFVWSRDGRFVAMVSSVENDEPTRRYGVFIMDTQTHALYQILALGAEYFMDFSVTPIAFASRYINLIGWME